MPPPDWREYPVQTAITPEVAEEHRGGIQVRRNGTGPYVRVPTDAIHDRRISYRALGLYAFLLSLPPDSEPTPRWLARQAPEGEQAIRTALAQLEACGYIEPCGFAALRISIPLKLRYQTLRRDRYACRYCAARAADGVHLMVDHVVPVIRYGKTVLENLITACDPCNGGKSDAMPEPWLIEEVEVATQAWLAYLAEHPEESDDAPPLKRTRNSYVVKVCR
jgi:HNH endonuclease